MQQLSLSDFRLQLDCSEQWPVIESLKYDDGKVELLLTAPKQLSFFSGHFPGQPVLPGIVQIHWVGKFSQVLFKTTGFGSLSSIKFNNMVLPHSQLLLQLDYLYERNSLKFIYSSDDKRISSGLFSYDYGVS